MSNQISLAEIIEEVHQLPCSHPASVNIDVAQYYYCIAKMLRPLLVVEIGCFIGFSTLHFAKALQELSFGRIISIDAFDHKVDTGRGMQNRQDVAEYYRKKAGLEDILTYIKGYSTVVYPEIKNQIKNKIDLLYIDGDHSVNGVFGDFNTYYNDVRVGGYVIIHDIYPEMCGVRGPRVLIDHLKAYRTVPNDIELIEMPTRDGFGIAVLHKKSDKNLNILLPEASRMKRIKNKLLGKMPFFPAKIRQRAKVALQLTVIDGDTESPVSGAKVICRQRYNETRTSNEKGLVVIENYLPNRYLFDISSEGYVPQSDVVIDISADKLLHQVTIALKKHCC
ncbi:MAG: class I SAM-dependent methyltransferase [Proteobacteria bacterium]|nr:class I SAM-dependent methyltransferase [Pseudomonadota bacterium]MBU1455191.1 class I SAM-dependent methyltransferase [Pseudomonadota bacterium]